jgi:tetratricopeptide (TPR) repeat protein
MIEANPMGVGAGNWWIMFPEYADDFYYKDLFTRIIFRHPHNNFVWIASEIGIGVVFYIGMFLYALKHASKYLAIGLLGGMVIACFSALHERPFATLMLMTFIALACPMKSYKQPKLWVTVVIFCIVVFGFRYRSATWNRKMRGNLKPDVAINLCEGDSPFSSLTHVGLPWAWWEGMSYFELKRYNEAIPLLKRAQLQNPYNIYARNGAGIAYGIEGRRGKSAMFFAKAIEICPEFEDAKVNLKKLNRN